jgi:hypothetical protein
MKNLILIILLTFVGYFNPKAQNNLVFNNTIYKEFSSYNPSTNMEDVGTFTVPTGKVWKIESIFNSYEGDPLSNPGYSVAGGGAWSLKKVGQNFVHTIKQSELMMNNNIIWLNQGTYELKLIKSPSPSYKFNLLLTGIEFNLIP